MSLSSIIIVVFIVLVVVSLIRLHYSTGIELSLLDLVVRDGHLSMTMILQLVGGVVGTWVIVTTTANDKLTWDLFAIYLSYVASVEGFSKVVTAKYSNQQSGYRPYTPYSRGIETDGLPMTAKKTPGADE